MRQLYLAATGMNRGKTTFALGLVAALIDRGHRTGFIKPVGQRYAVVDGVPADEDAILVRTVFGFDAPLAQMSPVHVPRGFTKAFIRGDVVDDLPARIRTAHRAAAAEADVLVIEGTGHAGVGSVVGLSNAEVAARLGAPALIISEGGVGRPIDEIVLNHALFSRRGVHVAGAIVNKVDADADPSLPEILRAGLARHGIPLLGTLPYRPILSNPTLSMLVEQMPGELIHPGDDPERVIEHVAIGAMQPRHVLERVGPGSLLIVPGDREDVIHATIAADRQGRSLIRPFGRQSRLPSRKALAGLLFTGGYLPRQRELDAIRQSGLFAYLVQEDTYQAASKVHDLLVKTHPADAQKIVEIKRLVADQIDLDLLLGAFGTWEAGRSDAGPTPPDGRAGEALVRVRGAARLLADRASDALDRLRRGTGA
jgi:BioD-like phosphotransacetylase family protein